jgi:hypothetical protein
LIVAVGLAIASALSARVADGLAEEGFAQARFLGKALKAALLTLVGVLALWQLEFARQIVLAAFLIAFGSLGVAFALAVGLGSAKALDRGWLAYLHHEGAEQTSSARRSASATDHA